MSKKKINTLTVASSLIFGIIIALIVVQYSKYEYLSDLTNGLYKENSIYFMEECENDTYLEAWNRIPPNEPRAYLPAFLSKIVRNISLNRCIERKRLKRSAYVSELSKEMEQCIAGKDHVGEYLDSVEMGKLISTFLKSQSKTKRIIFMHRYYYLDSISDISKRFGYSQSKVKTMLFRMRKELREFLEEEGYIV